MRRFVSASSAPKTQLSTFAVEGLVEVLSFFLELNLGISMLMMHRHLAAIEMDKKGTAAVVVLGDIGRSPRMQYHALSLEQQANLNVDIVAYGGTDPHGAVLGNPCIKIHRMKPMIMPGSSRILRILMLPFKAIAQFFMLLWFLCVIIPAPDLFLVQNPPSVPTLLAVYIASWWRGSKFVVDWHNFGYTLLSLSLGRNNIMVNMYRWFEKHYGRKANASLCVTKAMQH